MDESFLVFETAPQHIRNRECYGRIDAARIAQIASLVRALVVVAQDSRIPDSAFRARLPHWMELENHFGACKSGLDARIITSTTGDTEPLMQVVEQLFDLSSTRVDPASNDTTSSMRPTRRAACCISTIRRW
jgi:gamma-glutamyl:cysteine ligase YbdK (ATP-grasp superfamily)